MSAYNIASGKVNNLMMQFMKQFERQATVVQSPLAQISINYSDFIRII